MYLYLRLQQSNAIDIRAQVVPTPRPDSVQDALSIRDAQARTVAATSDPANLMQVDADNTITCQKGDAGFASDKTQEFPGRDHEDDFDQEDGAQIELASAEEVEGAVTAPARAEGNTEWGNTPDHTSSEESDSDEEKKDRSRSWRQKPASYADSAKYFGQVPKGKPGVKPETVDQPTGVVSLPRAPHPLGKVDGAPPGVVPGNSAPKNRVLGDFVGTGAPKGRGLKDIPYKPYVPCTDHADDRDRYGMTPAERLGAMNAQGRTLPKEVAYQKAKDRSLKQKLVKAEAQRRAFSLKGMTPLPRKEKLSIGRGKSGKEWDMVQDVRLKVTRGPTSVEETAPRQPPVAVPPPVQWVQSPAASTPHRVPTLASHQLVPTFHHVM